MATTISSGPNSPSTHCAVLVTHHKVPGHPSLQGKACAWRGRKACSECPGRSPAELLLQPETPVTCVLVFLSPGRHRRHAANCCWIALSETAFSRKVGKCRRQSGTGLPVLALLAGDPSSACNTSGPQFKNIHTIVCCRCFASVFLTGLDGP